MRGWHRGIFFEMEFTVEMTVGFAAELFAPTARERMRIRILSLHKIL